MEKIIVELDVKSKKGVKEVEKLNKEVARTGKEVSNTKKEMKEANKTTTSLGANSVSAFNKFKGAVLGVVKGFKSLKFAIIATGIGALLIGILAVKAAFTNSEAGQNKFAKLMGVIGSITGNFIDIIAGLGEKIIEIFNNPKKAIKDFAKLIKDNIVNRFNGILELIPNLGKAIKQLFKGDFSGAAETAANAVAKVTLGTENLTESIKNASKSLKEFGKEVAADAKTAASIADKRAKADKIERGLIVERAKADRDIADLRFKSEQRDKFTAKERVKFLQEASLISEEIARKEISANKLRLDAQIAENKLSGSTKEDLNAVAELKAKGIQLDTAKLNLQKRLQTSLTTFQNEEIAGIKKISDAKQKDIDNKVIAREKEEDLLSKFEEELKQKKATKEAETELQKVELEREKHLLKLEQIKLDESQKIQAVIDVNAYYDTLKDEAKVKAKAKEDAETKKSNDKKLADLIKQSHEEIKLDKQKIRHKGMVVNAISQFADAESGIGKALLIVKQALALKETIMDLKRITFKGIEATGDAAVSTAQNVANSSKIGFPFNLITIAGAIAQGVGIISSVKSAVGKTKAQAGAGASASMPSVATPSMPSMSSMSSMLSDSNLSSTPPSFNTVGASDTNQLASAIGGQSQQPIQAFVVSSEVTTAQELDNNIVQSASL